MKENQTNSTPPGDFDESVFRQPILGDRMVLTTSGPVREALERHRVVEEMGEREVVFERRYLGRWIYKDE